MRTAFLAFLLVSPLTMADLAAQWRPLLPAASPPARFAHAMEYDPGLGQTVMFGGIASLWQGTGLSDTWTFDGQVWSQLAPANAPSPRGGAGLVRAPGGGLLLYGGGTTTTAMGDTWRFQNGTWTQLFPAVSPGPRVGHGMAFDSQRNRVVLYGGMSAAGSPVPAGTWEFDGTSWSLIATATNPGQLDGVAMCFHAGMAAPSGRVLLHGYSASSVSSTTWSYNGAAWTQVATPPGPFLASSFVYDPEIGLATAAGMSIANPFEVWGFDGASWTLLDTSSSTTNVGLAYDVRHHGLLAFGGLTAINPTEVNTTASWGAWTDDAFAAGCPGSNGIPTITTQTAAHPGRTLQFTVTGLAPTVPIMALAFGLAAPPAPVNLGPLGMPGCQLATNLDYIAVASANNGGASPSLAIPNGAAILGLDLYCTGLSFDNVNAFGAVVTNAIHGIVGY